MHIVVCCIRNKNKEEPNLLTVFCTALEKIKERGAYRTTQRCAKGQTSEWISNALHSMLYWIIESMQTTKQVNQCLLCFVASCTASEKTRSTFLCNSPSFCSSQAVSWYKCEWHFWNKYICAEPRSVHLFLCVWQDQRVPFNPQRTSDVRGVKFTHRTMRGVRFTHLTHIGL